MTEDKTSNKKPIAETEQKPAKKAGAGKSEKKSATKASSSSDGDKESAKTVKEKEEKPEEKRTEKVKQKAEKKVAKKKKVSANKEKGKGSKRYKEVKKLVDLDKIYKLEDGIDIIKKSATAKFDETIDIAMKMGIDAKKGTQNVRGMTTMPNSLGKEIKVAVFAKGDKAEEAKKAGADIVGADDLAEKLQKGSVDFQRCIATPDMMAVVGKLGKILGPKGLMPNPKLGTVTNDVAKAVKSAKSGQIEFKNEKNGIIHAGIAKASFKSETINENIKVFVGAVKQAKPSEVKGQYIKSAYLSSTMGSRVKLDVASL